MLLDQHGQPITPPKLDVWLEEEYWDADEQPAKRVQKFPSKSALMKTMEKKGGFSSQCLYDLRKVGEHTGQVYGQVRTLKILTEDPTLKETKNDEDVPV